MGSYTAAVCYNARQDNIVQYSTVQHKNKPLKLTHNTQDNTLYTKLQKQKNKK
jgi:hypothetical protein